MPRLERSRSQGSPPSVFEWGLERPGLAGMLFSPLFLGERSVRRPRAALLGRKFAEALLADLLLGERTRTEYRLRAPLCG